MEHLAWGLQISALGMGLVFALLALLWALLTLVLWLDREPPPAPVERAAPRVPAMAVEPKPAAVPPGIDAELLAVIAVATIAHRAQLRRDASPALRSHAPGSQLHASRWVAAGRVRQNHSWQGRSPR